MSEKKKIPKPFGYFKAEPFGWTDCAETDECAIPLYDIETIKSISKQRDSFKDAAEYNKRRAEYAERQRDDLLEVISLVNPSLDFSGWENADGEPIGEKINELISSGKGEKYCSHANAVTQYTGDGTPVEFCLDCGRNEVVGATATANYPHGSLGEAMESEGGAA